MKNAILFIVCCVLLCSGCSREPEKKEQLREPEKKEQPARESLSERMEIIHQAGAVQQKENKAIESRNKLVNDIFKKKQDPTPTE